MGIEPGTFWLAVYSILKNKVDKQWFCREICKVARKLLPLSKRTELLSCLNNIATQQDCWSTSGSTFLFFIWRQEWQSNRQADKQILWHHIYGYVNFFFHLNLLPPYSLCSQGDKCSNICKFSFCHGNGLTWKVCFWQIQLVTFQQSSLVTRPA